MTNSKGGMWFVLQFMNRILAFTSNCTKFKSTEICTMYVCMYVAFKGWGTRIAKKTKSTLFADPPKISHFFCNPHRGYS